MKKFNSLEEIRKEIDEIDIKVFDLICERKNLVSQVIKFKRKDQIIDEIRIKKILLRLEKEAKKKNIPYDIIENIWMAMIKSFIEFEEKIFKKNK